MDKLDWMDPQGSGNDVVQPEPAPAPEPEPQPVAQPRDEQGRFAPVNAEPAPAPEPTPEPQPHHSAPPPGYVPVDVVQAMRREMQALKAAVQPQAPEPDIFEDPNAFVAQQVLAPVNQQLMQDRMFFSEQLATVKYGPETVAQARDWAVQRAEADPMLEHKVLSSRDPFGVMVAEFKQAQVLSKLSDPAEIDQYLAWKAAQSQLAQQQQTAPAQPVATPQPAAPPMSIASAPSGGGVQHIPMGPGQAFDNIFRR